MRIVNYRHQVSTMIYFFSMHSQTAVSSWSQCPGSLAIEPEWVHVFRLDLDQPFSEIDWLMLSPSEQDRASRFRDPLHQKRFSYAHISLRRILASFLHCPPAVIEFSTGPQGKPALAPGIPLRFNLSHSAGMGLAAVSLAQEIGIDIEAHRPDLERESIARRFFSTPEASEIAAIPAHRQTAAFFACWTRKEAYLKARGGGLSIPLDSFCVTVVPGAPVLLYDPPDAPQPNPHWTLIELEPGAGFSSALAVAGSLQRVSCWDWPG
jgi:4'-phosphopantetheinyl transferase